MKAGYLSTKENVILRSDKKRTVIYFRNTHHSERMADSYENRITFTSLSPDLATAFYLMDGTRDYQTIIQFVREYFKLSEEDYHQFTKLLSGNLEIFYSSNPYPLPIRNQVYNLTEILPDLNHIDEFDMSSNYLFYPYTFLLIPSMTCDVDCIYCYADKKHDFGGITIEQWEEIIYSAAVKFKAKDISISGGDIFLYPCWKEFLSALAFYHFYPELPTKSALSYEDQKFIYDLGFKSYQLSLDTLNSDNLRKTLQIEDSETYKKNIITSIENADKIGLNISINCVQTRYTYFDIYETMQQLAIYNNIYRIAIDTIEPSLYRPRIEEIMLHKEDIPEYLHQIDLVKRLFQERDILTKFNEDPIYVGKNYQLKEADYFDRKQCNGGRTGVVILPDGKVTVCEELYWNERFIIGDLTKQTMEEIFDSIQRWDLILPSQSAIDPNSPCRNCDDSLFKKCTHEKGICWRDSLKTFKREEYPDYRCPFWVKHERAKVKPIHHQSNLVLHKKSRVIK
jgi:radical SAM protein with 4Fe4S-binding SPASM domain